MSFTSSSSLLDKFWVITWKVPDYSLISFTLVYVQLWVLRWKVSHHIRSFGLLPSGNFWSESMRQCRSAKVCCLSCDHLRLAPVELGVTCIPSQTKPFSEQKLTCLPSLIQITNGTNGTQCMREIISSLNSLQDNNIVSFPNQSHLPFQVWRP